MIALDENGNFLVNENGTLKTTNFPEIQNAQSECRCYQGEWEVNTLYGKNILIWTLTNSENDRCNDLYRICSRYYAVQSITYNRRTQGFLIT
jgi:hypothetical protein